MENAYVRSPRDVLAHFNVSENTGLSDSVVEASRQKYGKNGMADIRIDEVSQIGR